MADRTGDHTEKDQQTEQWWVCVGHVAPGFALRETCRNTEGVPIGLQHALCHRQRGQGTLMHFAVSGQPVVTDLQQQQGFPTDQAQNVAQVIAIQRGQCAATTVAQAIHQQCGIGCDRIAIHQPQFALVVIASVDRLFEGAEQ